MPNLSFGINKLQIGTGGSVANTGRLNADTGALGVWAPGNMPTEADPYASARGTDQGAYPFIAQYFQPRYRDLYLQQSGKEAERIGGITPKTYETPEITPGMAYRQRQLDALTDLQRIAYGTAGPSAAETMVGQQGQSAANRAISLARTQQGISPGAALRAANQARMTMGAETERQKALLRAQEQEMAQQQVAQITGQMYGNEAEIAEAQAKIKQQAVLAAQENEMRYLKLRESKIQEYIGLNMSAVDAARRADQEVDAMRVEEANAARTRTASLSAAFMGGDVTRQSATLGAIGTGISAIGSIAGAGAMKQRYVDRLEQKYG